MKKPMLILMLTLVAAVGMMGVASAQELIAFNITIGNGTFLLSPTQDQIQDQAQAQAQTSNNTNENELENENVNVAVSESEATNTNNITNTNTFNPVLVVENENYVGDITVSSSNINAQKQVLVKKFRRW